MNFALRSSLALLPFAFALGGCLVTAAPDAVLVDGDPGAPVGADVAEVAIDADAAMERSGGEGTALFVETTADGHWSITTACDTAVTGADCAFDVLVSPTDSFTALDHVTGSDLGDGDDLALESDGSIHLVAQTSFGLAGVEFDADPGAILEVDLLLDGVAQPAFVTWVAGGAVQQGAPSNPVDFAPGA